MKIAQTVARILLGLMFLVFGLNGFLHFIPAPPIPGLAGQFATVLFESHFYVLVFGAQTIAGALLIIKQYVPVALFVLAAVLANILTFHITMQPEGIGPGLVATVLWFIVALPYRSRFAPIFERTT
jgi:putative oxidoreductase